MKIKSNVPEIVSERIYKVGIDLPLCGVIFVVGNPRLTTVVISASSYQDLTNNLYVYGSGGREGIWTEEDPHSGFRDVKLLYE